MLFRSCNLLPACYVAPAEIRELRRMLRYRNLVVAQSVRMQNKMSGMLMEVGAEYNKQQLHGKQYFTELLETLEEVPESVKELLRLSRGAMEMFETMQQQLVARLRKEPLLAKRVMLLKSIRGGPSDVADLDSGGRRPAAVLFGGACRELLRVDLGAGLVGRQATTGTDLEAAQRAFANRADRGGETGARWNPQLEAVHAREGERGNRNRATLAVARKLVAYLLAVDKSGQPFQPRTPLAAETEVEKVA